MTVRGILSSCLTRGACANRRVTTLIEYYHHSMSSYNMADGAVHASSATTAHDAKGSYQGFATNPSTSRVSTPADQGRTFESERQARSNKQPFHQMVHGCEAVRIQTQNTCTPSASNNLPVRARQSLPLHRDLKPCADSDESDDSIVFISSSQHANSPTTPTATGQPPLQPRQSAPSSSTAPETYRTAQNVSTCIPQCQNILGLTYD